MLCPYESGVCNQDLLQACDGLWPVFDHRPCILSAKKARKLCSRALENQVLRMAYDALALGARRGRLYSDFFL